MIRPLLLSLVLSLTACGTLYDVKEYEKYIDIVTQIDQSHCTKEELDDLVKNSRYLFRYSFHRPNDQEVIEANFEIYESLRDLQLRAESGKISYQYCLLKLNMISALAGQYAEIVSKRPR